MVSNYTTIINADNDEIFTNDIVTWNISKLLDYLSDSGKYLYTLKKEQYCNLILNNQNTDKDKIDNVDLTQPIIVACFNNGKNHLLIDGIHRVRKAQKENSQTMRAYIVPFEEHVKFLINRDHFRIAMNLYGDSKLTKEERRWR